MNNVDYRVLRRAQTKDTWDDEYGTEDFLDPLECTWSMAPKVSGAKFRFMFGEIIAEDQSVFAQRDETKLLDKFIRIQTKYDDGSSDWETHWVGVIRDDASLVQSADEEGQQVLEALGLESLFQTTWLEKSWVKDEQGEIIILDWLPAFNRTSKRTRSVLGNRSKDLTTPDEATGEPATYVFGDSKDHEAGYQWTNRQIVEYLLKRYAPKGITWELDGQVSDLDLIVEVHHLRPESGRANLYDALNKLIDNKRGFSWYLDARDLDESGVVKVRVQTLVKDDVEYLDEILHANDRQVSFTVPDEFPFSHIVEAIQFRQTTVHQYEQIVVQGQPIRVMGTFHYQPRRLSGFEKQVQLVKGWSATEETDYIDAAGAGTGAHTDEEVADNYRKQDRLQNVYCAHKVRNDWNGRLTSGGTGPDGVQRFAVQAGAIPVVDDDGGVTFAPPSDDPTIPDPVLLGEVGPYWANQKVFSRDLLIRKGWDYTKFPHVKTGDTTADEEFRQLMVWLYDSNPEHDTNGNWLWADKLSKPPTPENLADPNNFQSGHVRPLDKGMGFYLNINPNHYYGLGSFPKSAATELDPEFDYLDFRCTAAFVTDERQQIVRNLVDPMPETVRTLYYTVKGAEYWYVCPKTVIDVNGQGRPVPFNDGGDLANCVLRNDYPMLKAAATVLEAWYATQRQALKVVLRRIHQWAELGQLWTTVEAAGWEPRDANTVVTTVHTDFREASDGVTIETGYDDLDYMGMFGKGVEGGSHHPPDAKSDDDYPLSQLPLRLATGNGGGGGSAGIWAAVVDKYSLFGATEVRGRYTCQEIEWLQGGTWRIKPGGRTFTNCFEASTLSNANIHHTHKNVVHLFKVSTPHESSSSSSSSHNAGHHESSSSTSSGKVDHSLYVFDKALGNILTPARV